MINRSAVNHQNPLVALSNFVEIALHHQRLQAVGIHRIQNGIGVFIAEGKLEHAATTHAVQRFCHHLTKLAQKRQNLVSRLANQRFWRTLRQAGNRKLLIHIAQCLWRIDHPHPLCFQQIQHITIVDIAQIERRILALQHHIHLAQIDHLFIEHAEKILILINEPHRAHIGLHIAVAHLPITLVEHHHPVPARLRRQHQGKRRVLIRLD